MGDILLRMTRNGIIRVIWCVEGTLGDGDKGERRDSTHNNHTSSEGCKAVRG